MRTSNLLVCFMVATIMISLSSATVFAQEDVCIKENIESFTFVDFSEAWGTMPYDHYVCTATYELEWSAAQAGYVRYGVLVKQVSTKADAKDLFNAHVGTDGSFSGITYRIYNDTAQHIAWYSNNNYIQMTWSLDSPGPESIIIKYGTKYPSSVGEPVQTTSCTDSDGGLDWYTAGKITGVSRESGVYGTWGDHCCDPNVPDECFYGETNWLIEYACTYDSSGNSYADPYPSHKCEYGCQNGICLEGEPLCQDIKCPTEFTCKRNAYHVCYKYNGYGSCSSEEIDGQCESQEYYLSPIVEYLPIFNENKIMITEIDHDNSRVKVTFVQSSGIVIKEDWIYKYNPYTNREPYWISFNTERVAITIIEISSAVSHGVVAANRVTVLAEKIITEEITQPILNATAICEDGPCIYGIYVTLGEMFKLQETQPVKIIDYLDSNNNPLKITFANVQKPNNAITLRLDFNNENIYMEPTVGESMEFFGANIKFVSIDDSWKYATIEVNADQTSAGKAGARIAVQTTITKAVSTLETVKIKASEQTAGISNAQEKILEVNTETDSFEKEINQRGIGYKFKWFFGMVVEQEKQDVEFLKSQEQKLIKTADLLLEISEQVEEPAKSILVEQSESLKEQAQEILEKAESKEKSARGFLSWFGLK
ncbi:MAG: hypothetical protein KJ906_00600 [Nanoarchaeota archaeon]|nr:hypothetical protein [Nanoarchaeota archaeon]